jgi:hypothetical protein
MAVEVSKAKVVRGRQTEDIGEEMKTDIDADVIVEMKGDMNAKWRAETTPKADRVH